MSLENQIVLVTGASRGIGRAIAIKLGGQDATVVGTATSESGAESISNYLKDKGIDGHGSVLNVNDQASIDHLIKDINEHLGAPTILINNAGITRDNLLMRMKEIEWDDIMDTNLKSVYRLSKACLRGMTKARQGRIISITSVVGAMGNAGQSNYAAAKAGVAGFSRALAREVGSRQITVNTVAPGFIETDMTKGLSEEQRATLTRQIPLGRLGQPEDVANTVAFLASEDARYVTGTVVHVNGGMFMA
ncbi:MAG TPA: 3-oxoacyl-ACP reductase FabG [Acidiferrobacteraceae bacterium]|nr:3-oxoacyl-ACP reductase FabG [Acidiferrobacteraceae bacterium]